MAVKPVAIAVVTSVKTGYSTGQTRFIAFLSAGLKFNVLMVLAIAIQEPN
ncbi:hypothetical protein H6G89_05240 [Oscillatoria sp. FACHB-1407]|nr:hypothetical protein [Oscillatoria sp. FACHB-1407]MBD2460443.1 hypothetical protein [Oscillatoria sp. FACHB-1407]